MPSPSCSAGEPNTLPHKRFGTGLPEDAEAARELLDGVIGWQLESLKDTLAEHERRAARNAQYREGHVGVRRQPGGRCTAQLWALSLGREVFRMVDTMVKVHKLLKSAQDAELGVMPHSRTNCTRTGRRPHPMTCQRNTHEVPASTPQLRSQRQHPMRCQRQHQPDGLLVYSPSL